MFAMNLNFLSRVFTGKRALISASDLKTDDDDDNMNDYLEGMFP